MSQEHEENIIIELQQMDLPLQAIFVLASGLTNRPLRNPITGEISYRRTSFGFNDLDSRGANAWGKIRLVAAAELAEMFPASIVVTLGRNFDNFYDESEAALTARELSTKYKTRNQIIESPESIDTFTELLNGLRLALEKNWNCLVFVCEEARMSRASVMLYSLQNIADPGEQAMVNQMMLFNETRYSEEVYSFRGEDFAYFRESLKLLEQSPIKLRTLQAGIIPGELVAPLKDRRYLSVIEAVRADPRYQTRKLQEERAARDWKTRNYATS